MTLPSVSWVFFTTVPFMAAGESKAKLVETQKTQQKLAGSEQSLWLCRPVAMSIFCNPTVHH